MRRPRADVRRGGGDEPRPRASATRSANPDMSSFAATSCSACRWRRSSESYAASWMSVCRNVYAVPLGVRRYMRIPAATSRSRASTSSSSPAAVTAPSSARGNSGRAPRRPAPRAARRRADRTRREQGLQRRWYLCRAVRRRRLTCRRYELLDEQRNTVAALGDCVENLRRQLPPDCERVREIVRFDGSERQEGDRRDAAGLAPCRLRLRPGGTDAQDARVVFGEELEQLDRRRVTPVDVLDNHDDGLLGGQRPHPRCERVERPPPLELGALVGGMDVVRRGAGLDTEEVADVPSRVRGRARAGRCERVPHPVERSSSSIASSSPSARRRNCTTDASGVDAVSSEHWPSSHTAPEPPSSTCS